MPLRGHASRNALVFVRWGLGMALISWRYLWQITPLYRQEQAGTPADWPPALPDEQVDEKCQLARDGVGPLFHRTFRVWIDSSTLDAYQLMAGMMADFNRALPGEVAAAHRTSGDGDGMRVGDELMVQMPGPWNAPVRVVARDDTTFRLVTLRGHLEAGQIEFRAVSEDRALRFEIEAWARPSTTLVHLLYGKVGLAKEMQLNMWVRSCLHAVALARGRLHDGVHIHTRRLTVE